MQSENANLETFARKLLEEKGLTNLDEEVRVQVERDLIDRLENRINATILAHLPKEKLGEFDALLDKSDEAAIQAFTHTAIPDLDEVVAQELLNFREIYING